MKQYLTTEELEAEIFWTDLFAAGILFSLAFFYIGILMLVLGLFFGGEA